MYFFSNNRAFKEEEQLRGRYRINVVFFGRPANPFREASYLCMIIDGISGNMM
jgi:hypothetical protein